MGHKNEVQSLKYVSFFTETRLPKDWLATLKKDPRDVTVSDVVNLPSVKKRLS